MELSWNRSSSIPDYSDDTFTSFSEEETCREYDSDSFVSYYSGEDSTWPSASDRSDSTWPSSGQNNEAVTRIPEVSEEELGALQSFCAIKINWLRRPPSSAPLKKNKQNDQRYGRTSEKPLMYDVNCIVPEQLVNRLHLKNIKETMKQLSEIKIHQPSQCPHCIKKRAELAKSAFLRRRKALMEETLLQEKMEEYLYTRDSLTLIGEIHRTLPKLSEDPRNIWQELSKRALKAEGDSS